ncbi:MAG: cobalt chelatase, partial [Deltaproteobacteria bacterium]
MLNIKEILKKINWNDPAWQKIKEEILNLNQRIEDSKEIEALLNGFNGCYIPAGPSGLITRGRDDVLPTGRNFYSLDPYRVPTKSAYEIGKRLAEKLIEKHLNEQGRYPENVAIFWMASDIMWADGEGMAQIMHLIGVRPVWFGNGRIKSFEIVPLEELGRPRIDVTIRVSGIIRDNFPNCIELIDEAIQKIATLDEPPEKNFIKKHTLEIMNKNGEDFRAGTIRIYC